MPNVSDKSTSGVAQVIMPKFALSDAILSAQVDTCSLQENLSKVVDRFVVCKCLVGTNNICTVTGVLKSVGSSFFILTDPCTNAETTCDLYSLKFVTSYPEGVPNYQMYCNQRLYDNEWT